MDFLAKAKQAAADLKAKAAVAAADLKDKAKAHVDSIGTVASGVKEAAANTALNTIQRICSQLSPPQVTRSTLGGRRRKHKRRTVKRMKKVY
jgi:hypothetical protein